MADGILKLIGGAIGQAVVNTDYLAPNAITSTTITWQTAMRWNVTKLQYKERSITILKGQITVIGAESDWLDVPTV